MPGANAMMDYTLRILVVDDFETMRRIIRGSLKKIGFSNIVEAEDGIGALKVLENEDIGLVMCDWNMPNMTGIEVLRRIRSHEKLKDIPFIMVTAEVQKENVIEAVKAGTSHYIVKPFTPEVLAAKIKEVFKKR